MSWFMDWGTARGRICFRLYGTDRNQALFEDVPHHDIPHLGLSLVFYAAMDAVPGTSASIQVRSKHLEMWGITERQLFEHARKNTPVLRKASIQSMWWSLYGEGYADEDAERQLPVHILSNEQRIHGAACILYDGVLEQAAGKFQSGFYVLPSSVHEVLLLPSDRLDTRMLRKLKEMVYEINHSDVLGAEDVLIDEAYYYDVEHGLVAAGQSGLG